jgi:hypothetical protein
MTQVRRGRRQDAHRKRSQAKTGHKGTNHAAKRGTPSHRWLTKSLRQRILAEANKLGLTPAEYLRMAVTMSESIRTAMPKDKSIDMKSMVKMLDSPLWGILVQSIGPTITGMLEQTPTDKDEGSKSETAKERTPNQPSVRPTPPSVRYPQFHPEQPVRPPLGPYVQPPQGQQPGTAQPNRPNPGMGQPQGQEHDWTQPNVHRPSWPPATEQQFFL